MVELRFLQKVQKPDKNAYYVITSLHITFDHSMKSELIPIGNSRGLRIPKALLKQSGLTRTVEITVRPDGLLISPARRPREGWAEAYATAGASRGEVALIPDTIANAWDADEWQWPAE
jgi:antitoxin MazE